MLIPVPAFASSNQTDFFGGAINVMYLIKILALIASGIALIKELSSRRSLFFIIGLILTAAFFVSTYDLNEMKSLGNSIKTFLKVHVKQLDDERVDLPEPAQKQNDYPQQDEQIDKQSQSNNSPD